jgi:ATP-dependent DNA helicase RecG
VVPVRYQPTWLDRAWERVREEVEKGHQVYVVCPRVDPDEKQAPGEPVPAAVEEVAPALAAGALAGLRVESLHGRMTPERKETVMRAFADGEVDVLVATTVIEVGVDVGNATMMVVLDADRFGVSQLHQLRGRVGRGGHPGLCLLVTQAEQETPAMERILAVAGTTDGFELSRVDLEQRREGDVLGAAQSGRASGLRLLSVLRHEDEIVEARAAATEVVAGDPTLAHHPALADAVRRLDESEQADYLEKA